jgi:hypothetical protein
MEIILLGKRLEDYPETEYYEKRLIYTTYSSGFREHNIAAFKSRLKKYFDYEIVNHFVKDGNDFWTTDEIIAFTFSLGRCLYSHVREYTFLQFKAFIISYKAKNPTNKKNRCFITYLILIA